MELLSGMARCARSALGLAWVIGVAAGVIWGEAGASGQGPTVQMLSGRITLNGEGSAFDEQDFGPRNLPAAFELNGPLGRCQVQVFIGGFGLEMCVHPFPDSPGETTVRAEVVLSYIAGPPTDVMVFIDPSPAFQCDGDIRVFCPAENEEAAVAYASPPCDSEPVEGVIQLPLGATNTTLKLVCATSVQFDPSTCQHGSGPIIIQHQGGGGCCLADGTCAMMTPTQCAAAGGYFNGVNCSTPCPRYACCASDGSCTMTFQTECPEGSVWRIFEDCAPDVCPPPKTLHAILLGGAHLVDSYAEPRRVKEALLGYSGVAEANIHVVGDMTEWNGRLETVKSNIRPGDTFLLYFFGHGGFRMTGPDSEGWPAISLGLLEAAWYMRLDNTGESTLSVPVAGQSASLSASTIATVLGGLPSSSEIHKVVVVSSCFAGGHWRSRVTPPMAGLDSLPKTGILASSDGGHFSFGYQVPGVLLRSFFGDAFVNMLEALQENEALPPFATMAQLLDAEYYTEGRFPPIGRAIGEGLPTIENDIVVENPEVALFSASTADFDVQASLTDGIEWCGPSIEAQPVPVAACLSGGSVSVDVSSSTLLAYRWQREISVGPFVAQGELIGADGAPGDNLGESVAISGDTMVVGAYAAAVGGNANQGAAYVFVRDGDSWTQQAKLTAADGASGDRFGSSVAIEGDTVVVGAKDDTTGTNFGHGSAYVFTRSGATWTQQAKLTALDAAVADQFGTSVAISGETVVIGSPEDDATRGSAYVFVRAGEAWVQQAKLVAADGAQGDGFGFSVGLSGDTAVAGAWDDDIGPIGNQGSAYVFVRSGSAWTQEAKLLASDGGVNDEFGISIGASGDTVVVGAYAHDVNDNGNQGAAYVYVRSGGTWSQQAILTAFDGAGGDEFGRSVAIEGDTVVAGAYQDDVGGHSAQGSLYVFRREGSTWAEQGRAIVLTGGSGDNLGASAAISGDTVVGGADGALDSGAAYAFVPGSGVTWIDLDEGPIDGGPAEAVGTGTASLSIVNPGTITPTRVRCRVVNDCGTVISAAAAMTLCVADFDCSGTVGVPDIFAYLIAWFAGDAIADLDGVNGPEVLDIFTFLNAWFAGCS